MIVIVSSISSMPQSQRPTMNWWGELLWTFQHILIGQKNCLCQWPPKLVKQTGLTLKSNQWKWEHGYWGSSELRGSQWYKAENKTVHCDTIVNISYYTPAWWQLDSSTRHMTWNGWPELRDDLVGNFRQPTKSSHDQPDAMSANNWAHRKK